MKKMTWTILSFSLLTIMSAAAVAPALGIIGKHFPDASPILIKLIVSLPPLFIILVNLAFGRICRYVKTRTLAFTGVMMYIVFGTCSFFVNDIWILLAMRALLGVSVGLIMPLSVGLLAYYYPPEEISRLMGLSAAMNQMGGVIATLLAGFLASIAWNDAFLVYLLGLFVAVAVLLWLPNERLAEPVQQGPGFGTLLKRFHPSIGGMFLCTIAFFAFVSNFALVESASLTMKRITLLMVGADLVAALTGMLFGRLMVRLARPIKYVPPVLFILGFALLAFHPTLAATIVACALMGIANGIGIPYMNTIASIKGGKDSVTTVLPILSATLFLAQFVSPLLIGGLAKVLEGTGPQGTAPRAPYVGALTLSFIYLVQVVLTRKGQRLPPPPVQTPDA